MVGSTGGARRSSLSPLWPLAVAAPFSALTAVLLLTQHRVWGGAAALVAAGTMLVAAAAARAAKDARARFTELVLDRVFDACVLAPLAWVARTGSIRIASLAMIGLGASFVASYERAKGQSLGYAATEGLGYQLIRSALLVVGLLTGWVEASLWAFAALTVVTATVRAWNVAEQERRSPSPKGASV
jgi:phosphatidylglycerophosphate synthase